MRRAFLAITGLAASTTALVVLKGSPGTSQAAQEPPAGTPVGSEAAGAPPSGTDAPAAAPTAAATSSPWPTRGATRSPAARPTSRAPAPRTTTARPPQQPTTTRRVTGPIVENEYGNVQVQIVLNGDRIVEALTLELPSGPGETERHSDDVRRAYNGTSGEVVRRQGADLDTVSGATETSDSYRRSLRAAIERA
ncbi:FMN-binding protein [Micromonospora costi]|uniref:FMN-binding protein n=1 Tax=Micromonospora costi TaxID=1530042 RepID=A0A3B0A9J5_9ACTN|nr:FMN-binding protein [Micromonospora costi]RKN55866.1 FMN-binding protein [Micromonospora costi]